MYILRDFFVFPDWMRKTENQIEMGSHKLGHKIPQAQLGFHSQLGIKYTFFFFFALVHSGIALKKKKGKKKNQNNHEDIQRTPGLRGDNLVYGTHPTWVEAPSAGTWHWRQFSSALETIRTGNVTSPGPAVLERWIKDQKRQGHRGSGSAWHAV